MRLYLTVLLIVGYYSIILSQSLPRWFFSKQFDDCKTFVGITKTGYYKDSSFNVAFEKACEKAVKFSHLEIFYNQKFISAIDKKYWSEFTKQINYDTSLISYYMSTLTKIDSFQTKDITVVLASDDNCNQNISNTLVNYSTDTPIWLSKLPYDHNKIYAIGASEEYYYETSSWEAAENMAILELARQKYLYISSEQSIEKGNFMDSISDIQSVTIIANLNNIEIEERWFDMKNSIYYVLISASKF